MIDWDDKYATGVDSIDRQHRLLFDFFNDFEEHIDDGRGQIYLEKSFSVLEAYAKAHFKFEENCMASHKCPVAGQNKEAHAKFITHVDEFQQKFKAGQTDDAFIKEIHSFLEKWITGHIIHIDGHLKSCVKI